MKETTILGIDLGTTNSLASIFRNKHPELIVNKRGSRMTPSVVSLRNKSEVLVGELARNQAVLNSEKTVSVIKRKMGTEDQVHLGGRCFSPVEISGIILRKIKQDAESFLGEEISDSVITVPAFFNDNQRLATKRAGELAGLRVRKLLNEPTAAALAYGYARGGDGNLLVVDCGGGTLDITLLEYQEHCFKIKGVGGSTLLGGFDFDQALVKWLASNFEEQHGVDLLADPIAHQQLVIQSEKAKIDLSTVSETTITAPYISMTEKGPLHLNQRITIQEFEALIEEHLETLCKLIKETLARYELNKDWVQTVILVGGSTRLPAIETRVKELFPEPAVLKKDLNPDEVVALGAGVLAGILSDSVTDMAFYDITSHNFGLENHCEEFVSLIPAGTSYPCEFTQLFTTIEENQDEVVIHVLQNGERKGDENVVSLGMFHLTDIEPAPAGEPNIRVSFSIDTDGLLSVTAINLDSGESKQIVITDNFENLENDFTERRGVQLKIV